MWEFTWLTKVAHHDTYPEIDPKQEKLSAAGKHVVVTGGGTGIGKSIATSFALAGAASVAIISRRQAVLEQAAKYIAAAGTNTKVVFASADAADKTSLAAAFKQIADQTGGTIDIFVSSAGSFQGPAKIVDIEADELQKAFDLNVLSSFNAFKAFLPYAVKDAHIYNISSGIGHMAPVPMVFSYALIKAAGIKLFDYIGEEHPNFHVVNVQPGVIATEMNAEYQTTSDDTRKF